MTHFARRCCCCCLVAAPENAALSTPQVLSFRATYQWHQLDARMFKIWNLAAHGFACGLVWLLGSCLSFSSSEHVASSLLFAAHPIHSEAVANVMGRAEMLCLIACLLSLACYRRAVVASSLAPRVGFLLLSLVLWLTATLCKETGALFLALLALEDLFSCWCSNRSPVSPTARLRDIAVRWLSLLVSGVSYLVTRLWLCDWQLGPEMDVWDNPTAFSPQPTKALSIANIHARYAWLAVWPSHLSADWSGGAIPLVEGFGDARLLGPLGTYTAILAAVALGCRMLRMNQARPGGRGEAALRCTAWGFVSFLPASNVLFPVGTVIGERLLY